MIMWITGKWFEQLKENNQQNETKIKSWKQKFQ